MIDRRTLSVIFTVAIVVGTGALLYAARHTVIAIIFAVFLAYILEPIVTAMQRWLGGSRGRGVAATYLALLVGLAIIALTVGPRIVSEARKLSSTLPALLNNVGTGEIAWTVGDRHHWSDATKQRVQGILAGHRGQILHIVDMLEARAETLLSKVGWILIVPVLSVFFLLGKSTLSAQVISLIDASHRKRILRNVLADLDVMLAQYIRAQLMLSLLAAAAYTVFLLIIRFPYAFAIGLIAGILEFIPLVGPILAGITMLGISFTTGYGHWIPITIFWLVWRGVQDYYNMPHLMRRELELHPLLAVTTVLAGGEIAGMLGMFLSIPAVGVIRVIWRNSVERKKRSRSRTHADDNLDTAA